MLKINKIKNKIITIPQQIIIGKRANIFILTFELT
jgi:hypothetical protein